MTTIAENTETQNLITQVEKWRMAVSVGDMDGFAATYTTDAVLFVPLSPDPVRGRQAIREYEATLHAAFPQAQLQTHHPVVQEQTIAIEWEYSGRNTGDIVTPMRIIPATRRDMRIHGASFFHFKNGLITQERRYYDVRSLYQQLGLQ